MSHVLVLEHLIMSKSILMFLMFLSSYYALYFAMQILFVTFLNTNDSRMVVFMCNISGEYIR